jgi:Leucine Rich repeat
VTLCGSGQHIHFSTASNGKKTTMEEVRRRLQNNDPSLTSLSLDQDGIVDDALEDALSGNTFLQELTIRNVALITNASFFSTLLNNSDNKNLKVLRLENVALTVQSIKQNNKNDTTNQERPRRGEGGGGGANPRLQELSLANNPKLGPRGCQELRRQLPRFPNLLILNLENIGMGHYGVQGMEFPPHLQVLNLSHNKLGIDGIWKLSLTALHALVELNVSHNAIADDGCMELTKILPTHLRSLTLSSNGIGTAGSAALAKALHSHGHLQELYLADNRIQQVDALADWLAQRQPRPAIDDGDDHPKHYNTNDDDDDDDDKEADPDDTSSSWEALSQSPLRVLDVSHNLLESTACLKLAEALRTNTTLQRLDLSYNRIDDEGAGGFVEILDDNTGLAELLLVGNESISDGRQRILEMLLKHRSQRVLRLSIMDDVSSTHRAEPPMESERNGGGPHGAVAPEESLVLHADGNVDLEQVRSGERWLNDVLQSTEPYCLLDGGVCGPRDSSIRSSVGCFLRCLWRALSVGSESK